MFTAEREIAPGLDINGFIGGEIQRTTASFNTGQTSGGLSYPGNYFLANSVNEPISRGGIDYRRAFNSLYASADLAFKEPLYLQATWRGDWSSALTYSYGMGNNFFHYPAGSLSWIFNETFVSNGRTVSRERV